ncbi:MAG TPA: phytanoyl-CoA dioxygenase family protein [Bauldia sp.]|nr:phytanoyl-CoA dioxygenase family protein [Bauldia sp.]
MADPNYSALSSDSVELFNRDGFLAPVRLLTAAQCALLVRHLQNVAKPKPIEWDKGEAAADRVVFDIATSPQVLAWLTTLLGKDIALWGASFAQRAPGQVHPWHTDIESSGPDGGFVSVWIGLEHTSRDSGLSLVRGSHRFGLPFQAVQQAHGRRRGEAEGDTVLEWAREFDPSAIIVQPDVADGDAILFDGRIWHGSNNRRAEGRRVALILQYVRGDVPVFRPDFSQLEWPLRYLDHPRPPVLCVSGKAHPTVNRLIAPPTASPPNWKKITAEVQSLPLPLSRNKNTGWQPHFLFNGTTATLDSLTCHASVLDPGIDPHPPHAHLEEEILVVLDGEADIVLAAAPDDSDARSQRLKAGGLVYHPAFQHHTIRSANAEPVTYLMFKWRASILDTESPLASVVRQPTDVVKVHRRPFDAHLLFEGPTAFLRKLHCHLSVIQPGAGYHPHADAHDVAILLLKGEIKVANAKLTAPGVAYFGRGEMHGLRNVGDRPARYLVIEFHGLVPDQSSEEPLAVRVEVRKPGKTVRKRKRRTGAGNRPKSSSLRLRRRFLGLVWPLAH